MLEGERDVWQQVDPERDHERPILPDFGIVVSIGPGLWSLFDTLVVVSSVFCIASMKLSKKLSCVGHVSVLD